MLHIVRSRPEFPILLFRISEPFRIVKLHVTCIEQLYSRHTSRKSYTPNNRFQFPFKLNGIWSWWQFYFSFWTKGKNYLVLLWTIWFKIWWKNVTYFILFEIINDSLKTSCLCCWHFLLWTKAVKEYWIDNSSNELKQIA